MTADPTKHNVFFRFRPFREIVNLGLANWLAFKYHKKRQNRGKGSRQDPRPLNSRFLLHPVLFRPGTSDLHVFRQVFAEREYGCLDDCRDPGLVIDCGANVGYTSAYFLSRFPKARVVAVEPDADNFHLLAKNLTPYGGRAMLINAAVWPESAGLVVAPESSGSGQEWGRTVRPALPGETPTLAAVDIGTIFAQSDAASISILKIDIEGSEEALFGAQNRDAWLGKVENLVIELHGKRCEEVFFHAVDGLPFAISRSGELTVCKMRR